MGSIFAVKLARVSDPSELPGERIALAPNAKEPLRGSGGIAAQNPATLLVGAEREGLPPEVVAACERVARIGIASDSLNAAMAVTVGLYEMTRHASDAPTSSRVRAS